MAPVHPVHPVHLVHPVKNAGINEGRKEEADEESLAPFRRGWCLGSPEFKARMLERMQGKLGEHHSGAMRLETAEAKAERIVQEELTRLGWDAGQLHRKNDPRKLAIAARLRRETTLSLKAIAARIGLGSSKSANATIHRWMAQRNQSPSADFPNVGI